VGCSRLGAGFRPSTVVSDQECKQWVRLLKNDPVFGSFVPLVFPLAVGMLAKIIARVGRGGPVLNAFTNLWVPFEMRHQARVSPSGLPKRSRRSLSVRRYGYQTSDVTGFVANGDAPLSQEDLPHLGSSREIGSKAKQHG